MRMPTGIRAEARKLDLSGFREALREVVGEELDERVLAGGQLAGHVSWRQFFLAGNPKPASGHEGSRLLAGRRARAARSRVAASSHYAISRRAP